MAAKGGQDKMAVVDADWFFTEENLEKLSDEKLLFILRDLQEIQKERRARFGGYLQCLAARDLASCATLEVARGQPSGGPAGC